MQNQYFQARKVASISESIELPVFFSFYVSLIPVAVPTVIQHHTLSGENLISHLYRFSVSTAKLATRLGWLFLDMARSVVKAWASASATWERAANACTKWLSCISQC